MDSRPLWTQLAKERNEERCRLSKEFLTKLKVDGSYPSPASNDDSSVKELKEQLVKWNMDIFKIINAQNESIRHLLTEIDNIKSILRSGIEPSLANLKEELISEFKSTIKAYETSAKSNFTPPVIPSNPQPPQSFVSSPSTTGTQTTKPFPPNPGMFEFNSGSTLVKSPFSVNFKEAAPQIPPVNFSDVFQPSRLPMEPSFSAPKTSIEISESDEDHSNPNNPSTTFSDIQPPFKPAIPETTTFTFGGTGKFDFKFPNPFGASVNPIASETDDCQIVFVKKPQSSEIIARVTRYQLPLNFYDYLNAAPCGGCRGCDTSSDIGDDETEINQEEEPYGSGGKDDNYDDHDSEPKVEFKPIVQLDLVETKTGEEDEDAVFQSRAKIFLFDEVNKMWKERGVGDFKILKNRMNGTYRMLLRRDKVLKVACNQRVTSELNLNNHPSLPSAVTWTGCDFSEDKEKFGNYCLRFKTEELKNAFMSQIEDIKKNFKNTDSKTESPQTEKDRSQHSTSSPFSFSLGQDSSPKDLKTSPNVSAGSVFGSGLQTNSPSQLPQSFTGFGNVGADSPSTGLFAQAIAASGNIQSGFNISSSPQFDFKPKPVFSSLKKDEEEGEEDVESEPAVDFKPLVQLDLVETKTGEEDEDAVFQSRAKVFLFDEVNKMWKERGVGDFKILKNRMNRTYRMLLRRDKVLKVACNQRVTPELNLSHHPSSPSSVTWTGCDFSEDNEKFGNYCLRFKTEELKNSFMSQIEDIKKTLTNDDSKIASPQSEKDRSQDSLSSVSSSPQEKNSSALKEPKTSPNVSSKSIFGSGLQTNSPSQLPQSFTGFGNAEADSPCTGLFAQAIAASGNIQSGFNTSSSPQFDFKPKPVFSSLKKDEEEAEEDVESEPAVDFKPLVQLDLVETKTGEEDEDSVFQSRAKVFLFDEVNKAWKERGVGDFKILKNRMNGTYRMLLRRDKVLKVACNQRVTPELNLSHHPSSSSSVTWTGCDFSEDSEKFGNYCLRFKTEELKNSFMSQIEDIKKTLVIADSKITSPQPEEDRSKDSNS